MSNTQKKHWLSKAQPKYWEQGQCWRVRAMNRGKQFTWYMKAGKGENSHMAAALAGAEWSRMRQQILDTERSDNSVMIEFKDAKEEQEHYAELQQRTDYADSPFSEKISYEEYREFLEWKRWKASNHAAPQSPINTACDKPFADIVEAYRAHLKRRMEQTKPGLKSNEDLSELCYKQYGYTLDHLSEKLGQVAIVPNGEFLISEKQLSDLLGKYREICKAEMVANHYTGHWINDRAKVARAFVTYLCDNRLLQAMPPNIAKLTEKYQIDVAPHPMPHDVVRLFWQQANDEFRLYALLGLNCGYRQTDLCGLLKSDLKTISGRRCIVKRRGKTGVQVCIPLWDLTVKALDKVQSKSDKFFPSFKDAKSAGNYVGGRFTRLRDKVAATHPEVKDYSFECFRDTGASFIESRNPMLTPLYLGHADNRMARHYVGNHNSIPMQLDTVLDSFLQELQLR